MLDVGVRLNARGIRCWMGVRLKETKAVAGGIGGGRGGGGVFDGEVRRVNPEPGTMNCKP